MTCVLNSQTCGRIATIGVRRFRPRSTRMQAVHHGTAPILWRRRARRNGPRRKLLMPPALSNGGIAWGSAANDVRVVPEAQAIFCRRQAALEHAAPVLEQNSDVHG